MEHDNQDLDALANDLLVIIARGANEAHIHSEGGIVQAPSPRR